MSNWFWDEGADVLPKAKALECVLFIDTIGGDELVAHPTEPDRFYVLPRDEANIYIAGDGLMPALDWLLTSGTLVEPISDRSFAPFDGRSGGD